MELRDDQYWDRKMSEIEITKPDLPDDIKDLLDGLKFDFGVTSNYDFPDDTLIGRQALMLREKASAEINIMDEISSARSLVAYLRSS